MRYLSFFSFLYIQLSIIALSATTYELNIAQLIPQQNLIQTVQLEAENLKAELTLNDGQIISALDVSQWPSLSDITQISVAGPEVQFKVTTLSGSEWTRSLSYFDFKLSSVDKDGRKEMMLDLHAAPSDRTIVQNDLISELNLGEYLFKALILLADEDIHLNLLTSSDLEDNDHPFMKMELELGKQSLTFKLYDQPDDVKTGAWKIRGNGFGKGSLIDLILYAIRMMSDECRKMSAESEYDQKLQKVFYGIDLILDLTTPISEWTGVALTAHGSFDYQSKEPGIFSTHHHNHFQLEATDGSWSGALGSKSYFSVGMEDSPVWSQEFILKNPNNDLEKAATWIQQNWTDQLAVMLDMPSIKYYSVNFS
ncbi:MAG: hypothetical protein H0T62_13265 [Parachlamydiaceae bacterium]|nr:hypothetical protein [Parachlamydiaceae bacterium]